jgi:hypothetical protein
MVGPFSDCNLVLAFQKPGDIRFLNGYYFLREGQFILFAIQMVGNQMPEFQGKIDH